MKINRIDPELVSAETIEEWRDIEGFPNYQVSNLGNVMSLNYNRTGKEKILKPILVKVGYFKVGLFKDKKCTIEGIHRLVARAFPEICGIWFKGCEIDHINTIRTDNRAVNLRVCTHKENMNNPISRVRSSEVQKGKNNSMYGKYGKDNPSSKSILQFSLKGDFVREWENAEQIKRELGFESNNIRSCCRGERQTANNFKWKYNQ